jgi:hypothetical protein
MSSYNFFSWIVESHITFLSQHNMKKIEGLFRVFFFFFFDLVNKNVLTSFKHDVHVCIFTIMYMFVDCICTKYIKACMHQGLNHKPHGNTQRS